MNYKVIITGSVGSGKSTAVNTLTNRNAILTDATVSESDKLTLQRKDTTTVAMDYDVIKLNTGDMVHVYGTPGQDRFDFMWDILSKGASGVIIFLDMTRNYPLLDLKHYTSRFSDLIHSSRLVVGLTHSDTQKNLSIDVYKESLKRINIDADVIPIDARKKGDVTRLFHALLKIPYKKTTGTVAPLFKAKQETKKEELSPSTQVKSTLSFLDTTTNKTLKPEKTIHFSDHILQEVTKIEHVTGTSLTTSMGELLHSTTNDEGLDDFIAFLSGLTPEIEKNLNKGKINRIMLRSPKEDNLTVFVEKKETLGVSSNRTKSIQVLSQQIEDILQWL
ncbi:MAG: ATP/GTP-binding protein [Methylococcales bacterium]|nr:ATP/GTP-binding protein [Methylococcales bacterium]